MSGAKLDGFVEAGLRATERSAWLWGFVAGFVAHGVLRQLDGWQEFVTFMVVGLTLGATSCAHAPRRGRAAYRVARDESIARPPS